jgi:chromobox protein 1
MDVLKAYWDKIGGKPQAKPKTPAKKGTKRKSLAQHTPEPDASSNTKKRGRKSIKTADEPEDAKTPALPEGSWEDHVELVEAIEKPDHGEFKGGLMFYLKWQDGHKTQHTAQVCRQKCPQKVIYSYPQPPMIC